MSELALSPNSPPSENVEPHNHDPSGHVRDGTHAVGQSTGILALGAIGVVYGDIGTSPLYAFREALAQTTEGGISAVEILGVLSLALWALILVVTVKYVMFLMRADNNGEGGVLSLMALARRATGGKWAVVTVLGALGAALFYGDALITPALSVLSAVEGMKTIPGFGHAMSEQLIISLSIGLLIALFMIQSKGTASVSKLFGPVCVIWFLAIGGVGLMNLATQAHILAAFNPYYAAHFLLNHGMVGLFVMGAVLLTVTGAEALTADMGHFGRRPIRIGWFGLVFPALALNYLGQGAFALNQLALAEAAGKPLGSMDWFFLMTPESFRIIMVILAALATIIASQAVITGAYSLTQQAISLGLLPRMTIRQTSEHHAGQIYVPAMNWLLAFGVLMLILGFKNSSDMAAAYGIAVTGTMVVTTCLAFIVVWKLWNWKLPAAILFILPFLALDFFFFGANILRVVEGGWVPLAIAATLCLIMWIWVRGRTFLLKEAHDTSVPLGDFAKAISNRPPTRVDGTAVFLTADLDIAPVALLHNLKHNKVLHAQNIVLSVRTSNRPHISAEERVSFTRINSDFERVLLTYGYMETPDIPADLAASKLVLNKPMMTSFYIGRAMLCPSAKVGLPFWQALIYSFLHKNASDPTAFFQIPPNRVVELGTRMMV